MKIQHLLLPVAAVGVATALLVPNSSEAYTLEGISQTTSQRDFRIYNNFTDAEANNNTVADTNFPGYQGAVMAIWKACIEWGSKKHGNGNGDAHQPGDLGSGGANFDPTFQGLATGVGNINDNICSEIAGGNGSVLAYTEYQVPFSGWRMRFYADWTWHDGPGTNIPNSGTNIDMQGVTCHEYGHALGLDHSADGNATMFASVNGTGVVQRSINADDIAGVQAIYQVLAGTKPTITAVTTSPGMVTITGTNFSATGNQVWFTQAAAGGSGTPVSVTASSNGVSITVAVPATAGPGDVLVKANFSGNSSLSNAWPFTPNTGPLCPSPYNYCFSSPNSYDPNGAYIGYAGTNIVSNNDFQLITSGVPPNSSGLYFFGLNEVFTVFGNGFRCVNGNVHRLPIIQANIFGDATWSLNLNAAPAAGVIVAGTTWKFQYWYRNVAGGGAGFNLSDALSVDWCP